VKHRFAVAIAIAVLFAGVVVFAQGQQRVTHERYTITSAPYPDNVLANCADVGVGDFLVLEDYSADIHDVTFYDGDGRLTRIVESARFTGDVLYNSTAPDKRILGGPGENQENQFTFDENGEMTSHYFSGPSYKFVVPGYGPIFMDTGHTRAVHDSDGWHVLFNTGHNLGDSDIIAVCNALK